MGILEVADLSISFAGKNILDGVSVDFWKGHVHAIVGPNGAGKSTLAYTLMGLEGYRSVVGDIRFEGKSIVDKSVDQRAKLGMTLGWQEPARYEGLSVKKFIAAAAKDKSQKALEDCLRKVGMNPDEYFPRALDKTLSGGERKKIELASILAVKPKLVLLDEPDSGIDVASLKNIFEAIKILKEDGATVILITHSLEVLKHAEHAFLMCHGKIVEKGSVEGIGEYFGGKCMPCDHKNFPDIGHEVPQ